MSNVDYTFRFYPSTEQEQKLKEAFGVARFVYNHCLDLRIKAFHSGAKVSVEECEKNITHLKSTENYGWLKDVPDIVITESLKDLDNDFNDFFDGLENNKQIESPRFKAKHFHDNKIILQLDTTNRADNAYIAGQKIKIPKIGELENIEWSTKPQGAPKMIIITSTAAHQYFVSFSVEEFILP